MDDRGFVSSVIYFDNGQPTYQDYLDPKGIWRFREHLNEEGRVEVNPIFGYRFKQLHYTNMSQLIAEYFDKYLQTQQKKQDIFIIPSHPHHDQFIFSCLPSASAKILSLFINRNSQDSFKNLAQSLDQTDVVLVDREDSLQLLQELYPKLSDKFYHLSPFDTRLRLGRSQTRKESILYYQLDFSEGIDRQALFQVLSFIAETKNTEVIFGAFSASQEQMEEVESLVNEIIQKQIHTDSLEKGVDYGGAENPLEENQEFVRLIVDLNKQPHLYTQIAGISAGIPQINQVETVYVEHLKNGYLISDVTEFSKAAHYYTDRLKEWNQALVYSIDKIKEHTGQRFLDKLLHWIEEVTDVKGL